MLVVQSMGPNSSKNGPLLSLLCSVSGLDREASSVMTSWYLTVLSQSPERHRFPTSELETSPQDPWAKLMSLRVDLTYKNCRLVHSSYFPSSSHPSFHHSHSFFTVCLEQRFSQSFPSYPNTRSLCYASNLPAGILIVSQSCSHKLIPAYYHRSPGATLFQVLSFVKPQACWLRQLFLFVLVRLSAHSRRNSSPTSQDEVPYHASVGRGLACLWHICLAFG